MIVPMKKYAFVVYHADYMNFLEDLRALGVLHVRYRSVEPSEELRGEIAQLKEIRSALKALGHRDIEAKENPGATAEEGFDLVSTHQELTEQLEKTKQELNGLQKEIDFLQPWGSFSIDTLHQLEDAGLHIRFFTCPIKKFQPEWKNEYFLFTINEQPPDIYFVVIAKGEEEVALDAEEIPTPEKSLEALKALHQSMKEKISLLNKRLDDLAATGITALKTAEKKTESAIQLIEVLENTREEAQGSVMLVEGFAPARKEKALQTFFRKKEVAMLSEKPEPYDPPPILLKNTWFSRLFEPIAKLFALPSYWELDLTPYFAPFFMLFFGFCLGDAGYGLFLLLAATIYKFRAKKNMKPILSLVQFLGGATILFGIITGTFFGMNLLEDQYAFLGNIRDYMLNSDQTFQLALILGAVQIFFGLLIKAFNQMRQYSFVYSISSFGWIILLLSLLDLGLLKLAGPVSGYTVWGGVGLILLFNDPRAGLLGRLGKGVWELYGITGIFGDLLSYIRLFALGISSAILGFVVNDIALQINEGVPYVGPVLFVLFLLIGHGLNLLIASLGAFVHPMRLTFVEFYKNAGFSGGGKAYKPFSNHQEL